MKLSIVIAGRDDGYGDEGLSPYDKNTPDTFCFRMKRTVESNLKKLKKHNISTQYVIVDWSPINGKSLDKNEYTSETVKDERVKHIIVTPEIVENRGWNPKNFYEYYAKNVGIRNSDGEFVLITNPDDLLNDELVESISKALDEDDGKNYYRPYSRIDVDNKLQFLAEGVTFLKNGNPYDEIMGTPAAGDFILTTKDNFINISKGFDETQNTNGNKQQTHMDGNIVINMYQNGLIPKELKGSVLHLDHAKPHEKDFNIEPYTKGYENIENWGLLNIKF